MNTKAEEVLEEEEIEIVEEEVNDDELMGAIDEELAETNPEPEEEVDDDNAEVEVPDVESPTKTDESDDGQEGEVSDAKDDTKTAPVPETDEGKPKEEKPSDEFGTLEDSVPEKTRERFETLKSRYDQIAQERDAVKAEADQWVEAITGTGTNPEQFNMALAYLSKVNSGKPEDLNAAYAIMEGELEALGKMLGKPLPGRYDPLDEHPDLKQKVDDGLLGEAEAQELIQARATQKLGQVKQQSKDAADQQQKLVHDGLEAVRNYGMEVQKSDPHFQEKMAYMEPIITAAVTSGVTPDRWLSMIKGAYEKLPNPAASAPAPKSTAPDPIRPTGATPASGAMNKEPGSELEALNQALEQGW